MLRFKLGASARFDADQRQRISIRCGTREYLTQGRNEIGLPVGFAQDLELREFGIVVKHQVLGISRGQEDLDAGPDFGRQHGDVTAGKTTGHH